MFNKTRSNIENKLSIQSLSTYVDELIEPYIINNKYPSLEDLLSLRLIKKVIVNPNIITGAYLQKNDESFSLTTKRSLDTAKPSDKFLLAHEIAHTFLYEIKSNRIFDSYTFTKSSLEQEFFCNFFARALLIPTSEITNDFKKLETNWSLKVFNTLSIKYTVPHSELLKRVLNDLEILENIVIIRFAKFPTESNWKVYETYMSESIRYNKEFYIPSKNFNKNVKYFDRFPTCFDKLSSFLTSEYNKLNIVSELEITELDSEIFSGKPLKHFSKNLTKDTSYNLSKSHLTKYNTDIINLMIKIK